MGATSPCIGTSRRFSLAARAWGSIFCCHEPPPQQHNCQEACGGASGLGRSLDDALRACRNAHRHGLNIVCGDINMARWQKTSHSCGTTPLTTFFEKRCIVPVADWVDECCFVAIRESFLQQLQVKGSSWGEQMDENNPDEKDRIWEQFLTQCGANLGSKDVHWPMQLAMSIAPGPHTRSSGLRQRSAAAQYKRNVKKARKGWGPLVGVLFSVSEQSAPETHSEQSDSSGRYSGSWQPPAAWTWHGWQGNTWWSSE